MKAACLGGLRGALLLATTLLPTRAAAVNTCNGSLTIAYVAGPNFAVPGDVIRVRLGLGAGTIQGGNGLTIDRVRFDLDCNDNFALGVPCTDEGAIIEYEGDATITSTCGVAWTSAHPVSSMPNEVVFTPSPTVSIPANTPDFCDIEFDVKVLSHSVDSTPNAIQETGGYVASQNDATCNNGLSTSSTLSAFIPLCRTCSAISTCDQTTGGCVRIFNIATKAFIGGAQIAFARKGGTKNGVEFLKVSLKEVFVTARDPSTGLPTGKRQFTPILVTASGPDAPVCSLVYPVVALAQGGAAARSAVQAQGYDCAITDTGSEDCAGQLSAQACTNLATQLSEHIDATLALGDDGERNAYRTGVQALGYMPCQSAATTTTSSSTTSSITTSSTTSTTLCSAGLTDCSGTCVNLTNNSNNCGTCGNVCPASNPSCINSVCTIP